MPCTGSSTCKTWQQINTYFDSRMATLIYTNYYFDMSDPNPAKQYIDDTFITPLDPNYETQVQFNI